MLTYGVELECFMPRGMTHEGLAAHLVAAAGVPASAELYNHLRCNHWKVVTDGSLNDYYSGAEVVSPVLRGEEGFAAIRRVCAALVTAGCTVRRTCGFHVHVAAPEDLNFFKKLLKLFVKYESILDTLISPSRRGNANDYCYSSERMVEVVDSANTLVGIRHALERRFSSRARFHKLNLMSYWRHQTVEFRAHQGTIDGTKAVAWVKVCLGLVARASENVNASGGRSDVVTAVRVYQSRTRSRTDARLRTYRSGMTREEAILLVAANGLAPAGRERKYVKWDEDRGFVTFGSPAVTEAVEPTADLAGLCQTIGATDEEARYLARRANELNRGQVAA